MARYKVLARQMYDAIGLGTDVDAIVDRFIAEDFVEDEEAPGLDATRETPRQMFKMMLAAFPGFRITVHDMLQDADREASRVSFSGTHQGDFMGVPGQPQPLRAGRHRHHAVPQRPSHRPLGRHAPRRCDGPNGRITRPAPIAPDPTASTFRTRDADCGAVVVVPPVGRLAAALLR
jgi:predicted ester cyclase